MFPRRTAAACARARSSSQLALRRRCPPFSYPPLPPPPPPSYFPPLLSSKCGKSRVRGRRTWQSSCLPTGSRERGSESGGSVRAWAYRCALAPTLTHDAAGASNVSRGCLLASLEPRHGKRRRRRRMKVRNNLYGRLDVEVTQEGRKTQRRRRRHSNSQRRESIEPGTGNTNPAAFRFVAPLAFLSHAAFYLSLSWVKAFNPA